MKTWIKTAMAAALAASVGLGASVAIARGGDCDGAGPMGERAAWRHGEPGRFAARAEERLTALEQDLKLKPAQIAAWNELKGVILAKAGEAEAHFREMRKEGPPATAVERMQRMEEFGRDRIEHMSEVRRAAETLYAGLDEAQKKTFDEGFRMMGPGGPGHHRRG